MPDKAKEEGHGYSLSNLHIVSTRPAPGALTPPVVRDEQTTPGEGAGTVVMGNGYGFTAMWGYGLLVTIGLVVLVVLAARVLSGGIGGGSADQTGARTGVADPGRGRARDILDERYARGELSTQEYEEQLRILAGGS